MAKKTNIKQLKGIAKKIRQNIVKMILRSGSGHLAGSLGMADVFTALYFGGILNHDPKRPNMRERDRVIMSAGHICPVLYGALAEANYFPKRELWSLRKLGSNLQGHTVYKSIAGVENTSGPLGQGISQAVGLAYALRYFDKLSSRVFCICSDGEHDEGQLWEAVMFAGKHKLSNLVVIVDRNHIQSDGGTKDIMPLEPLKKKYEAFNWQCSEVDGNDIKEVIGALEKAISSKIGPWCVIANTIPSKGIKFMESDYKWHAKVPTGDEAVEALKELGLSSL